MKTRRSEIILNRLRLSIIDLRLVIKDVQSLGSDCDKLKTASLQVDRVIAELEKGIS